MIFFLTESQYCTMALIAQLYFCLNLQYIIVLSILTASFCPYLTRVLFVPVEEVDGLLILYICYYGKVLLLVVLNVHHCKKFVLQDFARKWFLIWWKEKLEGSSSVLSKQNKEKYRREGKGRCWCLGGKNWFTSRTNWRIAWIAPER